jgi:hypothetical protein
MKDLILFILPIILVSVFLSVFLGVFKKIINSNDTNIRKSLWVFLIILFPFLSLVIFLMNKHNEK